MRGSNGTEGPAKTEDYRPCLNVLEDLRERYWYWYAAELARLERLVTKREEAIRPFEDPLRRNVYSEQLLSGEREPHFSRWLGWLIERIGGPPEVFRLLGIRDEGLVRNCIERGSPPTVRREEWSLYGHTDRRGRIDLVIEYPGTALVAVEVKLGNADEADLAKQEGYQKWLACQGYPDNARKQVLLALDGDRALYDGEFRLLRWREVACKLRRILPARREAMGPTGCGVALYFVGCVEQFLLGLISLEEAQGKRVTSPSAIRGAAEYLEQFEAIGTHKQGGDQ